MFEHQVTGASTTSGLPVAPSLGVTLDWVEAPRQPAIVDLRVVAISAASIAVSIAAGFVAWALTRIIWLVTNIAFFGRVSIGSVSPADNHLGLGVLVVPIAGGIIVGIMARYGSRAIRGHGIPEAMEQVLLNQSKIPARVTLLKPLSAAIAIGTGGPFGAEGPIIATGGAMGSLLGQLLPVTGQERKTLLAAGAAAGMAATFGCPVSAVLLAIELLLFEYRPRSVVPVAFATAAATAVRMALMGNAPVFAMPSLSDPGGSALATYVAIGAVVGVASVFVTRAVYAIEDAFEKLPVHWMWWPALGAIAVGLVGYFVPKTLGVGYDNIDNIVSGNIVGRAVLLLAVFKFISWSISLGSGTSGGTLAPLFTIGGGLGSGLGALAVMAFPGVGVDIRIAALVGMAAMFAGASRALLASIVFAFETTRQPLGLLPLLGGCSAAFLVSALLMRNSIMTEKIARRGVRVPAEYAGDYLERVLVRDVVSKPVVALKAGDTLESVRTWLASGGKGTSHQGFPVVDDREELVGVVTRRDLFDGTVPPSRTLREIVKRKAVVVFDENSLREAADHMVRHRIGRLAVVSRDAPRRPIGMVSRSDLLEAHERRLEEMHRAEQSIQLGDLALGFRRA
jgi:chloride channel protein, CIC family